MKRFQSLFSFLIAMLIMLSAVVFPAAERNVVLRDGASETRSRTEQTGPADPVREAVQNTGEGSGTRGEDGIVFPSPESDPAPIFSAVAETASEDAGIAALPQPESAVKRAEALPDGAARPEPLTDAADPLTADSLFPLTFGKDVTATLSGVDERHIYTFNIKERGFLRYSVTHAERHDFAGWEATLYSVYYLNGVNGETGFRPLNLLKTTALNATDASPSIGLMPGEYRITLRTTSGSVSEAYTLNAVFTPATDHEIECNDTKAAYTELYTDVPMIGSASCYADRQDEDWYLIRVRRNGRVQLTFSHETDDSSISVAWRVTLYNEAGTELYAENSGLNTAEIDSGEIGLSEGIYFISVNCRARCDADYTLTVTAVSDDRYEQEDNDSFEAADPLPLGGMIAGCVTSKAGRLDRDFYRFEMAARGNFALVFSHAPAALETDKNGWRVRLLSDSGEVLYSLISTWNASADRMPVLGLEAGVYFVEVCSEDMYRSNLTYTLIAGFNESTGFEMEPNNTPETANPIANGVPVTGAIVNAAGPDDDYYCFTVPSHSRVTVVLKHQQTDSERDIFSFSLCDDKGIRLPLYSGAEPLTDENGETVCFVRSLGTQPEAAGEYALTPGTYYIKVTSGRFFDSINYSISYYLN